MRNAAAHEFFSGRIPGSTPGAWLLTLSGITTKPMTTELSEGVESCKLAVRDAL